MGHHTSELVILTKYSLEISATDSSLQIIKLEEFLIVPEKRDFTVFQNFDCHVNFLDPNFCSSFA